MKKYKFLISQPFEKGDYIAVDGVVLETPSFEGLVDALRKIAPLRVIWNEHITLKTNSEITEGFTGPQNYIKVEELLTKNR